MELDTLVFVLIILIPGFAMIIDLFARWSTHKINLRDAFDGAALLLFIIFLVVAVIAITRIK